MSEVPLFLMSEVPLFVMREVPLFLMSEVPLQRDRERVRLRVRAAEAPRHACPGQGRPQDLGPGNFSSSLLISSLELSDIQVYGP